MPAIGIDLGTCYSSVAVWNEGQVEIIANDEGNRRTPSYVAFTRSGQLIGDAAKNRVSSNPSNTVYDIKRIIGRRFDDPKVQDHIKHWPFKIVSSRKNPKIQVKFRRQTERFNAEEISSMILLELKEIAEDYLGNEVKDVVITVPAFFNNAQRLATKEAAEFAGLNVLRIINEPTAAALAYAFNTLKVKSIQDEANVLIFDLGGGKLDVSIVSVEEKGSFFTVLTTASHTHLGGEDFDSRLVNHLCQQFERKYQKNIKLNQHSLQRLRIAVEKAKCTLSSSTEASIEIDGLYECIDYKTKISRGRFEELCADLFRGILEPVEKALRDAKLDKSSIHDVVLVGGSTRIPKIQSLLQGFFCNKPINISINPDLAVAYGAAVQAAITSGNENFGLKDVLVLDAATRSVGVETKGGVMTHIINRNVGIPCTATQIFTTNDDNQTGVTIRVFEGERAMTMNNNFDREFDLNGISPIPRGIPQISITVDMDCNGIFLVNAKNKVQGRVTLDNIDKNKESESRVLCVFKNKVKSL